jgi:hypothetical protein
MQRGFKIYGCIPGLKAGVLAYQKDKSPREIKLLYLIPIIIYVLKNVSETYLH